MVLTPANLILWRTVSIGQLDLTQDRSQHWIAFDRTTHAVWESGTSEGYLGRTSAEQVILGHADAKPTLTALRRGQRRDLSQRICEDRPFGIPRPESLAAPDAVSHAGRCMFGIYQEYDRTTSMAPSGNLAIYDAQNDQFSYIAQRGIRDYRIGWVLHGPHVVRYSRLQSSEAASPAPLWLECYDLRGQLQSRTELPGSSYRRGLSFHGRTSRGDLVFLDKTSHGPLSLFGSNTVEGSIVLVSVPSLSIQARHSITMGQPPQQSLHIHVRPDADQVVQILGNATIYRMEDPSRLHRFVIRWLQAYPGYEIWRQEENVVIRKQGAG